MKTIRHPQLLILTLLTLLAATVPAPAGLVHQWTFNDGTANDSAGTTHGTLYNGATISGGQLQLDGVNDYFRTGPLAESLSNRTLMVWVTLSNLTQRGGSALTLEDPTGADRFDGIVYGEQVANRWINGSDNARRWNTPAGTTASPVETSLGRVSIAIVYGDPGSSDNNIKIYRNGALYADYTPAYPRTNYPAGVADVLIGVRHSDRAGDTGTAGGSDAFLAGSIDEARIYDTALTASEIAGITSAVLNTNDSGPGSLRQAIAEAVSGDTITFHPTLSGQTLTLTSGQLFLEKNLTIDASALPGGITLNGNGASRILSVGLGVTASLDSLTVTNGFSTGSGGGIYNVGNLTVSRCTVAGNQAAGYGGGILNLASDSALIVNNSTIVGNIANDSIFGGGGIMNFGTLSVNSSTIVGNSAPNRDAGGIFIYAGGVSLTNSIIAGNTQLSGGSIREYNTNYAGAFNLVDVNPLLTPLGHYGGPTPTMVPLPGSPAINTGGATTLLTDQRGSPRVVGPATDRGAVEVQPLVVLNTNDSGPYALRTAVASASGGDTITFTAPLSGQTITLTSGQLLINKNLTIDASALPGGVTVNGNAASRVFQINSGVTAILDSLTITGGNADGPGGGIQNEGTLTVNHCLITSNAANNNVIEPLGSFGGDGGGIHNTGTLVLSNSIVSANTAPRRGGGLFSDDAVTMQAITLEANQAGWGGGIYNLGLSDLKNSTVVANSASQGGGIYNQGSFNMRYSTVDANSAGTLGGGIYNQRLNPSSYFTGIQNTIANNGAGDKGGGVYSYAAALTLYHSTIAGNASGYPYAAPDGGGGIYIRNGQIGLFHCTVTANTVPAANGGGGVVSFWDGINPLLLEVKDTIIAGNVGGDVYGDFASLGYNLVGVGTATSSFNQPGDLIGSDPRLAPLGNYGGPTPTMPPLLGSPAIDAGVATGLTTDQRGYPRLSGAQVDIGAVEVQVVPGSNPPALGHPVWSAAGGIGTFTFTFTNVPNADFSVVTTTNVALPLSGWTPIGYAIEVPAGSGQYQFMDSPATTEPQRIYGVATPLAPN